MGCCVSFCCRGILGQGFSGGGEFTGSDRRRGWRGCFFWPSSWLCRVREGCRDCGGLGWCGRWR